MKTILIFTGISVVFFACNNRNIDSASVAQNYSAIIDSAYSTSCPNLFEDVKGNLVLSYVRDINDSVSVLCYVVSHNGGKSFGSPVVIPSSRNIHPHGENLPKVLCKPNGEIIAVWGADNANPRNKYSGLVYYSQSFNNGKTWTEATPLVSDTSSHDQRYFDIALLSNGEAGIIWLDDRLKNEHPGSTLYFAATQGKTGFVNEKNIGETCCQCCRTDMLVDSKGNIHVAYRDIINDSIRDMVHQFSTDNGDSFSEAVRISADNWIVNGCPHTGPTMCQNKNGVHFAWYTMGNGEGVFYCHSKNGHADFSGKQSVSPEPSAKHPQITSLKNENIVMVWNETVRKEDKVNTRIGLQHRNAKGKVVSTQFITNGNNVAEFPVVKPCGKNICVAFTESTEGIKKVIAKYVDLSAIQ